MHHGDIHIHEAEESEIEAKIGSVTGINTKNILSKNRKKFAGLTLYIFHFKFVLGQTYTSKICAFADCALIYFFMMGKRSII